MALSRTHLAIVAVCFPTFAWEVSGGAPPGRTRDPTETRVTARFVDARMRTVLQALSEQTGVELKPDRAARHIIDTTILERVAFEGPLDEMLRELLSPHNLAWELRGGAVEVFLEPGFRARAVRENIEKLKDPDRMVRKQAVRELRAMESAQAVPALIKALADPDIDRKVSRALVIIGRARPREAVGQLVEALRHQDVRIRGISAVVLGQIGSADAVPGLIEALRDPDRRVRRSAARALGAVGDSAATAPLVRALKDGEASVRAAAAGALGDTGDPAGVEALAAMLKDADRNVRYRAVGALGRIRGVASRRAVESALKDDDASIREEAARILRPPADPRDTFWQGIQHTSDPRTRALGAIGLGGLGDRRAVPALIDLLAGAEKDLRFHAAEVLGELGDPSALPALRTALGTEEEAEVLAAIREAIPRIEKAQEAPVAPSD